MTKFHIEWKKKFSKMPDDPAEMVKIELLLLEMVKDDLKTGKLADWGIYCNGFSGYLIMEGKQEDIMPELLKYIPFIMFDVLPVVNVDQTIDAINKVVSQMQTK
jgi:hypothetical protein